MGWHQTQHAIKLLPAVALLPPGIFDSLAKKKEKEIKENVKLMDAFAHRPKTTRANERLQTMINSHHHEAVQLQDRGGSSRQEGIFIVQKTTSKSLAASSGATKNSGTDFRSVTQFAPMSNYKRGLSPKTKGRRSEENPTYSTSW